MTFWNKLDVELATRYHDYLSEQQQGRPPDMRLSSALPIDGRVSVSLLYTGDLAEIEALGFEIVASWPGETRVGGRLALDDLERVAMHPGVLRLAVGSAPKHDLNVSVGTISARDQVWQVAGDHFTGTTGKGSVIGIIDSGIDFAHPYFRQTTAGDKTRILRLWDQSLDAQPGEKAPDISLLDRTGISYGVEYESAAIDAALADPTKVRQSDDWGHGTHVASIAAGNGGKDRTFSGVAPEAELIVVKNSGLGTSERPVDRLTLFRDAINYVLKAAAKDRPGAGVVINLSVSQPLSPPFGRLESELFLARTFAPELVGRACVISAGNAAGRVVEGQPALKNKHALVKFNGNGEAIIPIEMTDWAPYDDRTKPRTLDFILYYPLEFGTKLSAALQFPTQAAFIDVPYDAAPPTLPLPAVAERRYLLRHSPLTEGEGDIYNHLHLIMYWKGNETQGEHLFGTYTLKLTARLAAGEELEAHLYCRQDDTLVFRIKDEAAGPHVDLTERNLIVAYGGAANAITVAAYDAETSGLPAADFSSPGPLVALDERPVPPPKPEISAPGVHIDAANSRKKPCVALRKTKTQKDGTSMSAPHVAGVVALMFAKNKTLTSGQVAQILTDSADPLVPPESANKLGKGRVNAKKALDKTP